ncbi:MAG TPA: hypothetical protein PK961_01875 [bacterium]|nr:hypothetical protein [bacterium]
MVQVDVFWSYALGAGFAIAAHRQLAMPRVNDAAAPCAHAAPEWYTHHTFVSTVLFLATIFAPSGVCLLWAYPSWETMHVWDRSLWIWLVALFAITNVTQGVLGYYVVYKLIKRGKLYWAYLQLPLGYFLMFFILVHGWDGTGYRRFFSSSRERFLNWDWTNIPAFFVSDVGVTLYIMGLIMIPVLLYLVGKWLYAGFVMAGTPAPASRVTIYKYFLQAVFVGGLGHAVAASLLIRWLGWGIGLAIFVVASFLVGWRRGGYLHKVAAKTLLPQGERF